MGVNVKWEWPPGNELQDLYFEPGQSVHLSVQVRDMVGLPTAPVFVVVEIRSYSGQTFTPILLSGTTNFWTSNIDWDFNMPDVIAKARAVTNVDDGLTVITQNLGIGVDPDEQDIPFNWSKILPYAIAGVGVLALALYFRRK